MSEMLDIPTPSYRPQRPAPGLDPDMRRLGLIAGAIVGGCVVLAGAWSLSRSGAPSVLPIIKAPDGPERVKPEDPGGMSVIGAEDEDSGHTAASLAPAPETPELQALKARMEAARAAEAASKAALAARQAQQEVAAQLAPRPAPAPVVAAPVRPAATPAVPPRPAQAAPAAVVGVQVQLAAMSTQANAQAEWARLSHKFPTLFDKHVAAVLRADRPGKSTVWRLRTGGFADAAAARGFCDTVRAKGASCAIASF